MRASPATVVGSVMLLAATSVLADEPLAGPLRVPRVEAALVVDGILDEVVWDVALSIPVNTEVQPGENIEAPVRTQALLAYGPRHLYVGFRAFDPDPSQIRARLTDRDKIWDDDWVAVVLDTFNDERRSLDFFCNPLGVQGDMIESQRGSDEAWDAIWDSAGRIGPDGYTVEMAIPFSSIRFQKNAEAQIWGFDAVRSYPRGVRHHIGAFPRDRGSNCYLCQAMKIVGFGGADPGRNLELAPTLAATYAQARNGFPDGEFVERESETDPGLTARWSVTPNLTLNGTLNPDFSQVEADAAQLDINERFALFYPEKRPFFLEGADFFQLPINVVYTRTLADPDWGVKLSGKVDRGALGFFSVADSLTNLIFPGSQGSSSTALSEAAHGTALRYRHDVGRSSTLGVIATNRESPRYHNRLVGVDAALRFSREDTLYLNVFGSRTEYPDTTASDFAQPAGEFDGTAFDLMYSHRTRTTEHYVHYQDFDDGFRADLGFVPQVGYRFLDVGTLRAWYHDDPSHWFNQIRAWVGYERTEDPSGGMLRSVGGTFFMYDGPRQSHVYALLYLGDQSYRGARFGHDTLSVQGSFRPAGDVELGADLFYGDAIDFAGGRPATRLRLSPSVELLAGRHFRLALDHTYERLSVTEGRLYEVHLSDLRVVYQLNRRAFLRSILQHADYRFREDLYGDSRDPRFKSLLSQLLFSYKVNPQTALYVGYSDNHLGDSATNLTQVERTVFVKLGYAWVL